MSPEEAKRVSDLRIKVLEALHEGKDIRTVITREELQEALAIIRSARRAAGESHLSGRMSTKAPKAGNGKPAADLAALTAKLGL